MSNKTYKDEKGAIFTEDRKILLQVPQNILEYDVPEGTEEIGEDAFHRKILKVTLPNSLKKIWPHAFCTCDYIEKIVIPDSVEEIGFNAFQWCTQLKEIVLPKSLKEIEAETFKQCFRLERIVIPDTVTKIGESAFFFCRDMKELVLPKNLKVIGPNAFMLCHSLQSINLPDSLTKICRNAFVSCSELKEIVLPRNLKTIMGNPFSGYDARIKSLSPKFEVIDNALYSGNGKKLIRAAKNCKRFCVAEGTEELGESSLDFLVNELVLPASVKVIKSLHCSAKHVVFKGKVEKMPKEPIFQIFDDLEHITIPLGTKSHYDKLFHFTIEESDEA